MSDSNKSGTKEQSSARPTRKPLKGSGLSRFPLVVPEHMADDLQAIRDRLLLAMDGGR